MGAQSGKFFQIESNCSPFSLCRLAIENWGIVCGSINLRAIYITFQVYSGKTPLQQIVSPCIEILQAAGNLLNVFRKVSVIPDPTAVIPALPFCHSHESGNPLPSYNGFPVGAGNDELCCGSLVKPELTFPLPFCHSCAPFLSFPRKWESRELFGCHGSPLSRG